MPHLPSDSNEKPVHDWKKYYSRTVEIPSPERCHLFLERIPQKGSVLDFGCGSGRFAVAFHRDRPDLAIDVLDAHVEDASLLQDAPWIGNRLPQRFEDFCAFEAYDGIWSRASLFFLAPDKLESVFQALANALRPNGLLAFTFVQPCVESSAMGFTSLEKKPLEEMLHAVRLSVERFEYRPDMRYGESRTLIPTFVIHAGKS